MRIMPRYKQYISVMKMEIMIMASDACNVIKAIISTFGGNYFT